MIQVADWKAKLGRINDDGMYTIRETADFLGLTTVTVNSIIARGELSVRALSPRRRYVIGAELRRYITERFPEAA